MRTEISDTGGSRAKREIAFCNSINYTATLRKFFAGECKITKRINRTTYETPDRIIRIGRRENKGPYKRPNRTNL